MKQFFMTPKISIIVPVYNTEKYLPRCIDSILGQSFADFELLLIDDGSTDESGAICDAYAKKDDRVRVFHQPNKGVSAARNVGLKYATGDWIFFPDSDDIVMPDAFEFMMKLLDEQTDYLMVGYQVYDEDGNCTYSVADKKQLTKTRDEALMEMFSPTDYRYQGYLWNKLFKASIIKEHNISFVQGIKFNEDRLFNVEYLCHTNGDVAYTTSPVYQYIERPTSAMASLTQRFTPAFITDLEAFVKMRKVLLKTQIPKDIIAAHADAMYYSVNRYYSMCRQFNKTSLKDTLNVEKRLISGVGFRQWLHYRLEKVNRKSNKLCKSS